MRELGEREMKLAITAVINMICFIGIGMLSLHMGYGVLTWEFWGLMILSVIIGINI
jgi:hypothetical protein